MNWTQNLTDKLQDTAYQLYEAKQQQKEIEKDVKLLRDDFFFFCDELFQDKDHLLPVKTLEVPFEFFESTGMTDTEFIESRFPGWNIQKISSDHKTKITVFILKQDPHYIPNEVEVQADEGMIRVSKEISEFTPEIDWSTLKKERPDLFETIAQPITSYEIDEEAFEKLVNEKPEELATIQRHMRVKQPIVKATTRKIKDE